MSKLDQATLAKIHSVRIHPPIGVARVGNSTANDGWFYGPEIPGRIDTPPGGFKDEHGAVKRQAARFRLYGFTEGGDVVCELNKSNGFELTWKMEVGNQKAAWYVFQGSTDPNAWKEGTATLRNPTIQSDLAPENRTRLYIRSGEKTLTGINHERVYLDGKFTGSSNETHDIRLGEARTDEEGHLVVLAGYGDSRSLLDDKKPYPIITNDFDSPDWIDDTSDGWVSVSATHRISDQLFLPKHKARVLGSTPKFSTEVYAPTTLYDLMEDIYEAKARKDNPNYLRDLKVEWYQHIWPLLERPPRLSWVNGQANQGHGIFGPGNFFDEGWQRNLQDPSEASEAIRRGVLMRMRLPTDTELTQARAGQAYTYFMPWLSGDGGRTTDGQGPTFASVTRLQYDRLTKWANGEFHVGNPLPIYEKFDDIPLPEQPTALTKASLEPTIGAPLYPGIEMSWNAEIPDNYELDEPFTMSDKSLPGDLTKYLSCPWQSDFYMCRSYWWPSARPDAIVRKEDFEKWFNDHDSGIVPEQNRRKMKRVPWERGLRVNYTDEYDQQPLFANTDMVQFWHQLGFVVKEKKHITFGGLPVLVETERGKIHATSTVPEPHEQLPPPNVKILPPPFHGATKAIDSIHSLQQHLQSAMAVELSTIPIYLFGMYSVKIPTRFQNDPRYRDPIMQAVRNVVAEEMLHLSLAGNMLKAIGGVPKLYHPHIIPHYPGHMLHRIPKLELYLRAMTKQNLETFCQIEKPERPDAPAEPDWYHTLGQFYKAIKEGFANLSTQYPHLIHPETAPFQFAPGLGYQARNRDAGGSVIITKLDDAFKAIEIIVHQGEGEILDGDFDDKDHLEKDHYAIFEELRTDDKIQWETYPVIDKPKTKRYHKLDIRIYQVSRTFDAAYCFLLLTIEKLWDIGDGDTRKTLVLGNMFTIMMGVLAPLAKFLLSQSLPKPHENQVAAPCFDYYDFKGKPALRQLLNEMQIALDAYLDVTEETPDQVTVHNYGPQLNVLLPIQSTMTTLVCLNSFKPLAQPVVKKSGPGVNDRGAKGFGPVVL